MEFIFLLQGLKKAIRCCVVYCQGQEALGLSESERTSSEEPRAAVSVCQTMGVLDDFIQMGNKPVLPILSWE